MKKKTNKTKQVKQRGKTCYVVTSSRVSESKYYDERVNCEYYGASHFSPGFPVLASKYLVDEGNGERAWKGNVYLTKEGALKAYVDLKVKDVDERVSKLNYDVGLFVCAACMVVICLSVLILCL